MIAYTATYDVTVTRHMTVVATSAPAAERMVRQRVGTGLKLRDVVPTSLATAAAHTATVLDTICDAAFLDRQEQPATVLDWLRAAIAADADALPQINTALAYAGLRVDDSGIAVAVTATFPFWANVFDGTALGNGTWGRALGHVPGATRTLRTFAGIRSRAVVLPFTAIPGLHERTAHVVTDTTAPRHTH